MNPQRLLALAGIATLTACGGPASLSATATAPSPARLVYSVSVLYSPHAPGSSGMTSPGNVTFRFVSDTGEPLDILSATLTLLDDPGKMLVEENAGPSQGVLAFNPVWVGESVARTARLRLAVRQFGQTATIEITRPL